MHINRRLTDGAILVCAQQNTPKTCAYDSSILPEISYEGFAMYATLIVLVIIRLTSQAPLTLQTCSCVWLQIFKNTQPF